MAKQVGQTKDVGFQFGIRRTLPLSSELMWDFLFSHSGLIIWLGDLETEFELQKEFRTKNGINGFIRVFKPYSHIRLSWQKKEWKNISTVQVRVISKTNDKTVVSFHQEKLLDFDQRTEVKAYWNKIMENITEEIKKQGVDKV